MVWWNNSYPFRRRLQIVGPSTGAPLHHPAIFTLDKTKTVSMGKMLADYSDLAVVYNNTNIGRGTTTSGSNVLVEFDLQTALTASQVVDDTYYVYYGNDTPLAQPAFVSNLWPLVVLESDIGVTYTSPGEDWIDGVASKRSARATFSFTGDQVRIVSNIGKDKGVAEVQLDNNDWQSVDLYHTSTLASIVYAVTSLSDTTHTLRVRVSGHQNPASNGSTINIVRFEYRKNVHVIDLGEQINDNFTWSST